MKVVYARHELSEIFLADRSGDWTFFVEEIEELPVFAEFHDEKANFLYTRNTPAKAV